MNKSEKSWYMKDDMFYMALMNNKKKVNVLAVSF